MPRGTALHDREHGFSAGKHAVWDAEGFRLGMPHRQLSREYRQLIRHIGYGISGLPVAFEYQGAYHADPAQMRIDAAKRNALQLLGWIVILVTADDLRTADTRHRFIEMAHVVVSRQRNLADWNRSWAITS